MRVLVDMNLSPEWVRVLSAAGHDALHWSSVGDPRATDRELFAWAARCGCVVLTHDLDFGAILAATRATAPSVVQLRSQDVTPTGSGTQVCAALTRFTDILETGALISLDDARQRVRILPLRPEC
jgi:predicted nuclease of predicted toxin-antitoxin system